MANPQPITPASALAATPASATAAATAPPASAAATAAATATPATPATSAAAAAASAAVGFRVRIHHAFCVFVVIAVLGSPGFPTFARSWAWKLHFPTACDRVDTNARGVERR